MLDASIDDVDPGPSSYWNQTIAKLISTPVEVSWNPPAECGAFCAYSIEYEAPALECRDVTSAETTLLHTYKPDGNIKDSYLYKSNTSLIRTGSIDIPGFYNFTLEYRNMTTRVYFNPDSSAVANDTNMFTGGTTCIFRNATYQANFEFVNNTRAITTTILKYRNFLGNQHQDCFGDMPATSAALKANNTHPTDIDDSGNIRLTDCLIYTMNTRATCEAFANAFGGEVNFWVTLPSTINVAVVQQLFDLPLPAWNMQPTFLKAPVNYSFDLQVSNLSQALTDLFSNLTLGIMTVRSDSTTIRANTWDGQSVWTYNSRTLWLIYTPAISVVFAIGVYGLYCLHSNGMEMDSSFSHFLLTTRNEELDAMVKSASGAAALTERKLRWKDGVFVVDTESIVELERLQSMHT